MKDTRYNSNKAKGEETVVQKPTVRIELVHPAKEALGDADGLVHALAYGLADMVFYCWLCTRVPQVMAERHPDFLFRTELVTPGHAMHGIPGSVDVTGIDFPDGRDHTDEADEFCFGTYGFSDEVLGLVSELRAEPWDVNLADEHRRMPWENTSEMRELLEILTDWHDTDATLTPL